MEATLTCPESGETRPRCSRRDNRLYPFDTRGRAYQIDSAAIRTFLDTRLAKNVYAASEAAAVGFGDRLRARRGAAGLTQSQLAHRSGLTQEMISNLERGKHQPRFETLERYAKGLGLSVAALPAGRR